MKDKQLVGITVWLLTIQWSSDWPQLYSSVPSLQSCFLSQTNCDGMHEPSSHVNSVVSLHWCVGGTVGAAAINNVVDYSHWEVGNHLHSEGVHTPSMISSWTDDNSSNCSCQNKRSI